MAGYYEDILNENKNGYYSSIIKSMNKTKDPAKFDRYEISPNILNAYTAPTAEDKSSSSANPLSQMTVNDIYALYDDLLNAYPDYISKKHHGDDESGNFPIYQYEFKPQIPSRNETHNPSETMFPKMFINTATHGVERISVWVNYLMMREICNNWESDEVLEALRWDVHFIVIPLVNPWGFENKARKNANGVDLNRNFKPEWQLVESSSESYGGEEPLSELETQYVYDVMVNNNDITFTIDFHSFFSSPYDTPKNFIWTMTHNYYGLTKGRHLISKLSREWKKRHSFLADRNDMFGYASYAPDSSLSHQAFDLGLNGFTIEVEQQFELEPEYTEHNTMAVTLGLETFTNYVASLLRDANVVINQ